MLAFTIESDAVQGTAWRESIDELVALAGRCDLIVVGATTGAIREATRSGHTVSDARRREVFETVDYVTEIGRWGMSQWDSGAVWGGPEDVDLADPLARLLTGKPFADLSLGKREDIQHLCTHARSGRDVFVTTDGATLARKTDLLREFGIRVQCPADALQAAQEHCLQ